jgi:hypothetical protein
MTGSGYFRDRVSELTEAVASVYSHCIDICLIAGWKLRITIDNMESFAYHHIPHMSYKLLIELLLASIRHGVLA